jgi:hypothetical protein
MRSRRHRKTARRDTKMGGGRLEALAPGIVIPRHDGAAPTP